MKQFILNLKHLLSSYTFSCQGNFHCLRVASSERHASTKMQSKCTPSSFSICNYDVASRTPYSSSSLPPTKWQENFCIHEQSCSSTLNRICNHTMPMACHTCSHFKRVLTSDLHATLVVLWAYSTSF
jgi:hypothetical protein